MSFEEVINACFQALREYDPIVDSPDTYIEKFNRGNSDQNFTMFVQQVFYGCNRYRDMLKALIRVIFTINSTSTNSNDTLPFTVISYLAIFRYDELGPDNFRKLVETQEPLKMHVLLSFLFNEQIMRERVYEVWCQFFDYKFVDQTLIGGLIRHKLSVNSLLDYLSARATTGPSQHAVSVHSEKQKVKTVPKPFNLTKPRPRALPRPVPVPRKIQANQLDPSIFQRKLEDVEKESHERRAKVRQETYAKYGQIPKN